MVKPLVKHKIVKKRTKKFVRHQRDRFMRLQTRGRSMWRAPRGIDSRARRRFKGNVNLVNIGYGTNKKYKHVMPNGFKKFAVNNVEELELLLMHNRTYAAEIGHAVSFPNRKAIIERAAQLNIKVLIPNKKARTE